jgi:hypothetical protein
MAIARNPLKLLRTSRNYTDTAVPAEPKLDGALFFHRQLRLLWTIIDTSLWISVRFARNG